jgi:hypothetical protein
MNFKHVRSGRGLFKVDPDLLLKSTGEPRVKLRSLLSEKQECQPIEHDINKMKKERRT